MGIDFRVVGDGDRMCYAEEVEDMLGCLQYYVKMERVYTANGKRESNSPIRLTRC